MTLRTQNKTKLGLNLATDPRWVNIAEMDLHEILVDHAWCEQKAATSCISLIVRFSEFPEIVSEISPIVAEEWGHFRKVVHEINKRGGELGEQRKDEYVNRLLKFIRKGGKKTDQLVENLLICAMIEARSAERFRLLSLHISDEELRQFYHDFMVSEAGHYKLFLKLAMQFGDEAEVSARWQELLQYEADLLSTLELRGDRMH
jgi:tRNA-(ms[2]io[6]A)-hydroxylase